MYLSLPTRTRKVGSRLSRVATFLVITPPVLLAFILFAYVLPDPSIWEWTPRNALVAGAVLVSFIYVVVAAMFVLFEIGVLRIPELELDEEDQP